MAHVCMIWVVAQGLSVNEHLKLLQNDNYQIISNGFSNILHQVLLLNAFTSSTKFIHFQIQLYIYIYIYIYFFFQGSLLAVGILLHNDK